MASSIHIEKVTTGSLLHNDRKVSPSYLIDDSSKNECSASHDVALQKYYELKAEAEKNYTERTGQKMQKSTVYLKEAIVNLNENHTLKDLEPIKQKLEGYGFTVLQMSIHRDEGFKNGDKLQKNYHAHITMFNLDKQGKTVKFGKDYRNELSKLQTFTADTLKMERGKISVEEHAKELEKPLEKATKRLGTHEYKHAMKLKEEHAKKLDNKIDTLEKQRADLAKQNYAQDIKLLELEKAAKSDYNFRDMQKKITALETQNTDLKKELHKLNTEANKSKDENLIAELETKIKELEKPLKEVNAAVKERANEFNNDEVVIKDTKKLNEALTERGKILDNIAERFTADRIIEHSKGGLLGLLDEKRLKENIEIVLKEHNKAHAKADEALGMFSKIQKKLSETTSEIVKKVEIGLERTKTALFSILGKSKGMDKDNPLSFKNEPKEAQMETLRERREREQREREERDKGKGKGRDEGLSR